MALNSNTIDLVEKIKIFESIRNEAREFRNNIAENYPWEKKPDIRVGIFEQIDNLIRSFNLSTLISIRGFSDSQWINHQLFRSMQLTHEEKKKQLKAVQLNLHDFHRIGYIYAFMQVIEGTIRSIARKIIPNEDATGSFGSLCKKIYQQLVNPGKISIEMRTALDLLKEIRNTIHNNGFYFPDKTNKKGKEITYKGEEFKFFYGKPHANATYSVLADITREVLYFFKILVEDPAIANIENIQGSTGNVFSRIGA